MSDTPLVVVMGVAGCGKSTIGGRLAERIGVAFIDGDDLHPAANVEKMANGRPLTDTDRLPWLTDIGRTLHGHREVGLVVACSALRRPYRDIILREEPRTRFIHLHGEPAAIHARLAARPGHFMGAGMLAGQLQILEELADDEPGLMLDVTLPVEDLVRLAAQGTQRTESQR
ncbi:MAG TPA: gluconokinase [Leifsonia sp.]|jgi:carbohydrate kinase (thermoresistant glucokinase family)|nr:gluconokinase [Leifsonia sp.]